MTARSFISIDGRLATPPAPMPSRGGTPTTVLTVEAFSILSVHPMIERTDALFTVACTGSFAEEVVDWPAGAAIHAEGWLRHGRQGKLSTGAPYVDATRVRARHAA